MRIFFLSLILAITISCTPGSQQTAEGTSGVNEVRLTKAPDSPQYPEASLRLETLDIVGSDSVYQADFNFSVSNYELGAQTEGADTRGIANSGKGQHIHLIVNNGPYSAHYDGEFSKEMEEGDYVVLAFLSRSYHESVKNSSAYFIDKITVGEPEDKLDVDFTAPHMFYSRPKGTYIGDDINKLMIDFYLLNTTISPNGNKVKAAVNDNEFMIDQWAPYYIEGLSAGEVKVKLELIDSEGNLIPGPFNSVERTVTLKDAE